MELKKKVFQGVKWTAISTILLAFSGILKISVLTRYLDKSDFGLVAMVTFFTGIFELFNELGLNSAILYHPKVSKKAYSSLFWLNFVVGIVMYILLFACSPLIAAFYDEPELLSIIPLLGINLILSGFGKQFKTLDQKDLSFAFISLVDIVSVLMGLGLSIYLAIKGFGVMSLIWPLVVQSLLANLVMFVYGINKHGLVFHFRYSETKSFLQVGSYKVGSQVVNYFNRDLDILLIGKFFSSEVLGGYSLAKQLVLKPVIILNPILTKVASPALATFQKNSAQLRENYFNLVNLVSFLNFLIYALIALFARDVVNIMYGPEFLDTVILVRILCVYMIFRAIGNPIGSLVISTGRTDLELKWNILNLIITPFCIYIASFFGIVEVTLSLVLLNAIMFYPSWKFLVYQMCGGTFLEYLKAILVPKFSIMVSKIK